MRQLTPIIATPGQTEFEIPSGYVPGSLVVTVNGVILQPADFTATDGRSVSLAAPLSEGDEVGGLVFGE